jgi:hypothetical protein
MAASPTTTLCTGKSKADDCGDETDDSLTRPDGKSAL